jgi:hypothetical protein
LKLFQANIADKEEQSAVIRGAIGIDFDGQRPRNEAKSQKVSPLLKAVS